MDILQISARLIPLLMLCYLVTWNIHRNIKSIDFSNRILLSTKNKRIRKLSLYLQMIK